MICDRYAGVSAHAAEDVFGVAPDYFLARTRFASVKYVWGRMFDGIRDIHGSLGLNYKSFSDPYGYISTLQSLVWFFFPLILTSQIGPNQVPHGWNLPGQERCR